MSLRQTGVPSVVLSDHFIRSQQHIRGNRESDLFRRLEIDHEFEFRRLLHRQIRRLGAFQDSVDIMCDLLVAACEVPTVVHESADIGELLDGTCRREPALQRKIGKPSPIRAHLRARGYVERIGALLIQRSK